MGYLSGDDGGYWGGVTNPSVEPPSQYRHNAFLFPECYSVADHFLHATALQANCIFLFPDLL